MYKLAKNFHGQTVIVRTDSDVQTTSFGENPDNTDYIAYLKWLEEGNTPEPAEGVLK